MKLQQEKRAYLVALYTIHCISHRFEQEMYRSFQIYLQYNKFVQKSKDINIYRHISVYCRNVIRFIRYGVDTFNNG